MNYYFNKICNKILTNEIINKWSVFTEEDEVQVKEKMNREIFRESSDLKQSVKVMNTFKLILCSQYLRVNFFAC